jgi:general secretion pathway protein L
MTEMRTLLLQLPPSLPGPSAVYGVAEIDLAATGWRMPPGSSPLALLPQAGHQTEVVALVPPLALSWHRVKLPAGLGAGRHNARLQAALQGLLEDQLLQDTAELHLALAPQAANDTSIWVAACNKAWLQAHLHALQEAGLTVQRIVPELSPPNEGQQWHALGDETHGWLWGCDAVHGVSGWPVADARQLPSSWWTDTPLKTEPGLAHWAQAHSPHPVQLVDSAAHWVDAARSPWNLAQFELQSDARTRRLQGLRRLSDMLWRSPPWRPARWGLTALLLVQLAGMQTWAWMTRQQWQAEQDHWTHILQQSFPKVTVVVDAPLQMAREVARLRQGSGELTAQDLESQLQALGKALPQGVASPTSLNFQDGQLQWPTLPLHTEQQTRFEQALRSLGYRLSSHAGQSHLSEVQP